MGSKRQGYVLSTILRRERSRKGFTMVLSGLCCAFLILLAFGIVQIQAYLMVRQKDQFAVEAAAVHAARDLSRAIVSDPYWGEVCLSDQPACGKATLAQDGEPLPVFGVNTITNVVRTEKLLAECFQDGEMHELADADRQQCLETTRRLQNQLESAVRPSGACSSVLTDIDGRRVDIYANARREFVKTLPEIQTGIARLRSFSIRLGWLADGSTTLTPNPERTLSGPLTSQDALESFVDLPVAGASFLYAGLSDTARLVDCSRFRSGDGKRFCNVILVEAEVEHGTTRESSPDNWAANHSITVRAAAIPAGVKCCGTGGSLVVHFPQGTPKTLSCLRDIFDSKELLSAQGKSMLARGGDFPLDPGAVLVEQPRRPLSVAARRAFFDWLRTNGGRASIESIRRIVETPFDESCRPLQPRSAVVYSFDKDGQCKVKRCTNVGFLKNTIADGQSYDVSYGVMNCERGEVGIAIRNQVTTLSPEASKHGGQPILSELPADLCSSQGSLPNSFAGSISPKVRQSYRHGGLAAAIECTVSAK